MRSWILLALVCGCAVAEVFFEERFDDGNSPFNVLWRRYTVIPSLTTLTTFHYLRYSSILSIHQHLTTLISHSNNMWHRESTKCHMSFFCFFNSVLNAFTSWKSCLRARIGGQRHLLSISFHSSKLLSLKVQLLLKLNVTWGQVSHIIELTAFHSCLQYSNID